MPLTNNSSFTQAEGLSEGSRGLERQRKPPVGSQNKYDPERVAETRIGRFWHPFQGAGILTRVRGYRFAQPPATFWQPFGLAKPKRQFLIVCQRHNPGFLSVLFVWCAEWPNISVICEVIYTSYRICNLIQGFGSLLVSLYLTLANEFYFVHEFIGVESRTTADRDC